MSTLIELRQHATSLRQANEELDLAVRVLLSQERREPTFVELHSALRRFGEAAQNANAALRLFCEFLAVDPRALDGDLDALIPPLVEHEEDDDD